MKNKNHRVGELGAHTSASGGVWNALLAGASIGASTVQLFTANQRRWKSPSLSKEAIERFREVRRATGLVELMSHASYLLNLGSPNVENLEKSRKAFREEILRCQGLGIRYLNFHPGSALGGSREECLKRIVKSLLGVEDLLEGEDLYLLIEMTAGQGSNVGCTFEEVGYMVGEIKGRIPVGVCVDTCHIFAAGYDIRTEEGWKVVLDDFERWIGLGYLRAFHLNDSIGELGSRKDRHAPLGKGKIGEVCFRYLMESPVTCGIPKYLETPGGMDVWKEEIRWLRGFVES